jgi:hypothetical protein
MDGRTTVGGLLMASGGLFAFVAGRALLRGLRDAGTPSLIALGGIAAIASAIAALGVLLVFRSRRDDAGGE